MANKSSGEYLFIAISLFIVSVAIYFSIIVQAENISLLLCIIISILLAVIPAILFNQIMQLVETSESSSNKKRIKVNTALQVFAFILLPFSLLSLLAFAAFDKFIGTVKK